MELWESETKEMVLGGVMRKKISAERLKDLHKETHSGHRACG